ncbi:DUF6906 family protein [Sporanaerobium hydrogeniformans]|uniref:DUF6906 family protein n=1 Tax=Sporanaerobium hydrogeniformans TaxID=3072179 RepID=UPI0015D4B227|nr:hypothetical protein [Sporanaerobium hydrogeniformans]
MKQGKAPNKKQKILIRSRGLDYNHWLVVTDNKELMKIKHRTSNRVRNIYKEV